LRTDQIRSRSLAKTAGTGSSPARGGSAMIETLLLEQLPHIWTFAAQVAVSGVCICIVVLACAWLLSRAADPFRYGIFFIGAIILLAVPALVGLGKFIPSTWLWPAPQPSEQVIAVSAETLPDVFQARNSEALELPAKDETPSFTLLAPSIEVAVMAVWALGMGIGCCGFGVALWKQRRIILGQRWSPSFWTAELRSRLCDKLGLREFPDVYVSPVAPMPMVVGRWRPTILVPEQAQN